MKPLAYAVRHAYAPLCWLIWLAIELYPPAMPNPAMGMGWMGAGALAIFLAMLGCVFSVVRHADHLADLLGEPLGTLVLTLSATAIEVSLMLMVMLNGGQNPSLLRDTVFATLMVLLNGVAGLCLTVGGWRHRELEFNLRGALAFLHLIAPLSLVLLIIPDKARLATDGALAPAQEGFLGALCVLVYGGFLLLQTGRHRSLFDHPFQDQGDGAGDPDPAANGDEPLPMAHPQPGALLKAAAGLLFSIAPIVLLAEHLGGLIDFGLETLHAPSALGGLIVSALVLAPEGLGAFRAAAANRMQRAVNICLGSALSTIALTVPAVLIAADFSGHVLVLGLEGVEPTLLYASLIALLITLVSGRANLLQGQVHVMLFVGYLFFIFYP